MPDCVDLNVVAYKAIFQIENGLREFVIREMKEKFGDQWAKRNIPGDIRASMKAGKTYEAGIPWLSRAIYHPLYYADFPDLRKIVVQADNWRVVFQGLVAQTLLVALHEQGTGRAAQDPLPDAELA